MINVMELIKGQRLICLSIRMRICEIEQILKTTRHSGYPIIGRGQFLNAAQQSGLNRLNEQNFRE